MAGHDARRGCGASHDCEWGFFPGVNEGDIPLIAEKAGKYGARAMHILPAPGEGHKGGAMPDEKALATLREKCRSFFE